MTYQSLGLERQIVAAEHEPPQPHPGIPVRWLVLAICGSAAIVLGLMVQNGLSIAWHDGTLYALAVACAVLGVIRWRTHDATHSAMHRTRDFAENGLLLIAMTVLGGLASYAAAADTRGFLDPWLARGDAMLHFNWLTWYQTVASHPLLQHLGAAAYAWIYPAPWILIGVMAWQGERARARRFLATFWVAAMMTLALFPLFPAKGALDHLWHGPIPYMPTSGLYQGEIIPMLRDHTFGAIHLNALRGLVCAPSFHTVCATLFIATAWPMARLRWVLVPMNTAMLLATPVEGTHYLTDMLMGLAVALVALGLVRVGSRWLHRVPPPAWG